MLRVRFLLILALALGGLLVFLDVGLRRSARSRGTPRSPYKVMILGLDGADPEFLETLLSQGKLPHFERLIREGAYGPCRTSRPTKSVVIWTSIATGKRMEKHGIIDWMVLSGEGREKVLATGHVRKVEALWNIVSSSGKRVQFVDWWATWPAEKVEGEIVSNHFTKSLGRRLEGATYPESLYDELVPRLAFDQKELSAEMQRQGIPLYSPEVAASAFRPSDNFRNLFRVSRSLFVQDELYERAAHYLLESRGQPDLFGVIFRNIDTFSHFCWRFIDRRIAERVYAELAGTRKPLSAETEKLMNDAYAAVLEPVYAHEDERLGRFMERADPDTVLMVVSDHGFQFRNDPKDVERRFGFYHYDGPFSPSGVIFLWGRPIRRGLKLAEASIFDVCPTVLYLLGIPVGKDMDGRVLTEAIDPKELTLRPVSWVETWDLGNRGRDARPSPIDDQILDELRSLGYIQ